MRIVSLVPSQTELLHDLGLENEVIGITKFCIHPEKWFRNKTRVGGTKNIDLEKIRALKPDLIIANKEENERSQIEELQREFNTVVTEIETTDDAMRMIEEIGRLTHREDPASTLIRKIAEKRNRVQETFTPSSARRCAYLIWKDPFMSVNKRTFIHDQLAYCQWENIFGDRPERYPEVSVEELKSLAPDLLFLSSEPYPFKEQHIPELSSLLPRTKIACVDGEMFSWYGSRMLLAPDYFNELRHNL